MELISTFPRCRWAWHGVQWRRDWHFWVLQFFSCQTYAQSFKNPGTLSRSKKQEEKKRLWEKMCHGRLEPACLLLQRRTSRHEIVAGFLFDSGFWSPVHRFKMFTTVARQKCQQWLNALGAAVDGFAVCRHLSNNKIQTPDELCKCSK